MYSLPLNHLMVASPKVMAPDDPVESYATPSDPFQFRLLHYGRSPDMISDWSSEEQEASFVRVSTDDQAHQIRSLVEIPSFVVVGVIVMIFSKFI